MGAKVFLAVMLGVRKTPQGWRIEWKVNRSDWGPLGDGKFWPTQEAAQLVALRHIEPALPTTEGFKLAVRAEPLPEVM